MTEKEKFEAHFKIALDLSKDEDDDYISEKTIGAWGGWKARARSATPEVAPLGVPLLACVIEGTEYERGWGQRPDGYVAFETEEKAKTFIKDYDSKHNNLAHAPDEYTKYRVIGFKPVSVLTMLAIRSKGMKHADRLSEFNA